ncbi:MAG: response regulator [Pseudooceanicola sp.]|nr:response regulator [Pseudooceanicola sp.]
MLTLVGGGMLAIVEGPWVGAVAVAVALFGEAIDCLFLSRVPDLLARGKSFLVLSAVATLTAAIQALTIGFCVMLAWRADDGHAPFFALAFLFGAAVNAGIVLTFHPGSAIARLAVHLMTLIAGFISFTAPDDDGPTELMMNAAGAVVLVFIVIALVRFAVDSNRRNRRHLADMAEQRRLLQATNRRLQRSQKEAQQLALAARHANDGVVLMDSGGRITWVNDAFTRITGYSPFEAVGHLPGELLNGPETDPATVASIRNAARTCQPFRGEIRNRIRDGTYVWIETNQVPVVDENGQVDVVVAIERDVTEARRAAAELAGARDRAEAGARAKAEFLANMSHEIRTPMNGVIGMSDLLCDTSLTDDQRLYADTIRSSAQSLLALINDILDLSKLDAGKMAINPVDFDLHACLRSVVAMFRTQSESKGLGLNLDIAEGVPARVKADDTRLRQILVNLIGNAVKFTAEGRVCVEVTMADGPDLQRLRIAVRDTGIGIQPHNLDTIFERFSQAEAGTRRRFGGTGLGLTISQMLADGMGGAITAESALGEGACFTLLLPFKVAGDKAVPEADTDHVATRKTLAGRRVLVAEDNRVNRLIVERYLRDLPVALHFAQDGREAVERASNILPDLILMDMSMPVMNGIEAARAIRQLDIPQPAIVALTANAFDSDREACLAAGMDGFLSKPVRKADLIAAVADYAGRRCLQPAP